MVRMTIVDKRLKCPCGGEHFILDLPSDTKVEDVVAGKVDLMVVEMQCTNCYKSYIGMHEVKER